MTIGIINARCSIAREFIKLLPPDERVKLDDDVNRTHERYLICTGYLAGKSLGDLTLDEADATWWRNFVDVATECDQILANNPIARICVIGSESGYAGSYDMAYAGAKSALHMYVARKTLSGPQQQLVAIAPAIIWDSGMTQRRSDLALCEKRGSNRRRGRHLQAVEVARLAHFVLYGDEGSLSNVVIRQTGGNW